MSCFTFCLIAGTALYTNKKVEWDDWKVMVPDIVKTLIQEYELVQGGGAKEYKCVNTYSGWTPNTR